MRQRNDFAVFELCFNVPILYLPCLPPTVFNRATCVRGKYNLSIFPIGAKQSNQCVTPSLTKDLQREPPKNAYHWCGETGAEYSIHAHK